MRNFTKKLEVQGHALTFYFNSIVTPEGIRYHVSVVNHLGKTYMFHMVKREGRWVLFNSSNCPNWITALEEELGKIIATNKSF